MTEPRDGTDATHATEDAPGTRGADAARSADGADGADPPDPRDGRADSARFAERLAAIQARLDAACRRAARDPAGVQIIAVTKEVSTRHAAMAVAAGLRALGENDVRSLSVKREAIGGATWHFVGILQTNTAHRVAEWADVVHTAVPGRAVRRMAARSVRARRELPVLCQVDFGTGRAGVQPEDVPEAVDALRRVEGIRVVGLMTLPPFTPRPEDARRYFAGLRTLRDGAWSGAAEPGELSMGMSMDCEVAVEEGATMVRIGTALFGERPFHPGKT